jgi:hypothetical protein
MGRNSVDATNAWWMRAVRAARAAWLAVTLGLGRLWLLALGFLWVALAAVELVEGEL